MAITREEYYGRGVTINIAGNGTLDFRYRAWSINATAGSLVVTVPPITHPGICYGAPVFLVYNEGSNAFTLEDFEDTQFSESIAVGDVAIVSCYDDDGAVTWIADVRTPAS